MELPIPDIQQLFNLGGVGIIAAFLLWRTDPKLDLIREEQQLVQRRLSQMRAVILLLLTCELDVPAGTRRAARVEIGRARTRNPNGSIAELTAEGEP